MESIWNTAVTILATGLVIYGGHFLRDYLESKREAGRQNVEREREIRDARRKYRESTVTPVREALIKLQTSLAEQSTVDSIISGAKEQGVSLAPNTQKALDSLKELFQQDQAGSVWQILTKVFPVVAAITDDKTREHIMKVLALLAMGKETQQALDITDETVKEECNLAHRELEDYVAQAN